VSNNKNKGSDNAGNKEQGSATADSTSPAQSTPPQTAAKKPPAVDAKPEKSASKPASDRDAKAGKPSAASATGSTAAPTSKGDRIPAPKGPAPDLTESARSGSGSSGVAWLALLLVLGLAGGGGWYYLQNQNQQAALIDRMAYLEATTSKLKGAAQDKEAVRAAVDAHTSELDSRLASVESLTEQLVSRDTGGSGETDLEAFSQRLDTRLRSAEAQLRADNALQAEELQRLAEQMQARSDEPAVNINRNAWLLAEAEYLMRLANQRMIIAGDTVAAQALLTSADRILKQLDDISLLEARRALAADLAAVRSVPKLDVEGMYLRLAALIDQVEKLVIFELPDSSELGELAPADNWQERMQRGYQEAMRSLSSYIVVRRRDTPMEALMDPHWERMVRQNMRMLLEQSQVALLSGNQVLYQESLQRSLYWVAEFFESDEATARALTHDIQQLMDENIDIDLPDISGSLIKFDAALEKKLMLGIGE
jgi:uroporphyrin-III C-methyltransferase